MRLVRRWAPLVALVSLLVGWTALPAMADTSATIDFEGLAEGQVVNSVSSGTGISGGISGSVDVHAQLPKDSTNRAMIFDAECPGGCSGQDPDLNFPGQGNILIISEDLDSSDPDDADVRGAYYTFDFSGYGPGEVTVDSLVAMDFGDDRKEHDPGQIELYEDGSLLDTVQIPELDNNEKTTVTIDVSGVDFMKVEVGGSGAIDDIRVTVREEPPPTGEEGCTPGFWKTHPGAWEGFEPGDDFDATFGVNAFNPNITLMDAMWQGGGDLNRLGRHGTAALLNSAHSEVDYPLTTHEVIDLVKAAITSGDHDSASDQLEVFNEEGCDVSAGPAEPRTNENVGTSQTHPKQKGPAPLVASNRVPRR